MEGFMKFAKALMRSGEAKEVGGLAKKWKDVDAPKGFLDGAKEVEGQAKKWKDVDAPKGFLDGAKKPTTGQKIATAIGTGFAGVGKDNKALDMVKDKYGPSWLKDWSKGGSDSESEDDGWDVYDKNPDMPNGRELNMDKFLKRIKMMSDN